MRLFEGGCISEKYVHEEVCRGGCPSFEAIDMLTGEISAKECTCCTPDVFYMESIVLDCYNRTTKVASQRTIQVRRIQSCKCMPCLGSSITSNPNQKKSYELIEDTTRSQAATKKQGR